MARLDFDATNAAALASLPRLLPQWFPHGKPRGREFVVGDIAGTPGESLSINLDTGRWADFADASLSGGDPISLYAAMRRLSQADAARELAEELGVAPLPPVRPPRQATAPAGEQKPAPIVPVPPDAPAATFRHARHGEASRTWAYHDAAGCLLGYVCRFDKPEGHKEILPRVYTAAGWQWQAFPKPRPLYGLPLLAARPHANVVVVEGEKAADAARGLLPQAVVVTWPGGCKAVKHADWTPLAGRKVALWPDADEPGRDAALAVAQLLKGRAAGVRIAAPPAGKAEGWDAADAAAEGWTADAALAWLKGALRDPTELCAALETPGREPGGETEADDARRLPVIDVTDYDLPTVAGEAWAALEHANDPPILFRFGGLLVRLETDDEGRPRTAPLGDDRLRHVLSRAAGWGVKKRGLLVPTRPPLDVVRDLQADAEPQLPRLTRLVTVPTFARDGRLVREPGYDAASGLYYAPEPGLPVPAVPDHPAPGDLRAAVERLDDLLADFPFVEPADKAHAIALALLPAVRDLIDGPTPLHLIEAPTPGSGKGLLAESVVGITVGARVGTIADCRDDDEWRKRLTAVVTAGHPAVLLDNVTRPLVSGVLASALTASAWEDRLLGRNELVHVPIRCVWITTANNPTLSLELARRAIRVRLDPRVDRPWQRDGFRHPDLRGWAHAQRGPLLGAVLTLARAWLAAGRPTWAGTPLGSYEAWSRVLGGILAHAGVAGFLGNLDAFYEAADVEGGIWRRFFAAWAERFGEQEVGVADLLPLARETEGLVLKGETDRGQQTSLGMQLTQRRDRVIGEHRSVRRDGGRYGVRWRLLSVRGAAGDQAGPRGTFGGPLCGDAADASGETQRDLARPRGTFGGLV